MVISPSWYELTCIDSMLWGKNCRVIRVESWEVFLDISGTVWNTATKLCMLIDIMEGQVLVVKNL